MSNAVLISRPKQPHEGRASRSEFWKALILIGLFGFGGEAASWITFGAGRTHDFLLFVLGLITFLPMISVSIRRLHDLNYPGWYLFIMLVPVLGVLVVLFWGCISGTAGSNKYGDDPRGITTETRAGTSTSVATNSSPADQYDVLSGIERLAELRASGALSEAEFSAMKAKILSGDPRD